MQEIAFATLILAAAAFVQSVTGFGMALVCMAALPLVIGVDAAIALVAIFNLLVTANIMWWNRAGLSWKDAWPLVLAMVIGIPIGYFGMKSMDSTLVIRVLGAVLAAVSISDLILSKREKPFMFPKWAAFPAGIVGGTLGGAFNVGGPPLVAFAYSQNWPKTQTVAVLQCCFLAGGISRNALMFTQGDHTLDLFKLMGWAILPSLVTIWLGKKLLDRLSRELLRTIVFTSVLLMGIKYLFWP